MILISSYIFSQEYKTGLGFRLSPSFHCFDVKHFFSEKLAFEGMLNIVSTQSTFVGLVEFEKAFPKQEHLNWYFGIGGAIRFPNHGDIVISADGILGLEYTFTGAPINLSIDWKPAVEIINGNAGYPSGFGLSVRYTFKK